MVHSCSAYNCTQRWKKGISFYKFPKDDILLKKWIHAVRRKDWKPSATSKLCSRHFTDDCYEKSGWSSIKKLKDTAIPSIFDFSEQSQKKNNKAMAHPRKKALIDDEHLKSYLIKEVEKKETGCPDQVTENKRVNLATISGKKGAKEISSIHERIKNDATTNEASLLGRMLKMLQGGPYLRKTMSGDITAEENNF